MVNLPFLKRISISFQRNDFLMRDKKLQLLMSPLSKVVTNGITKKCVYK